MTRNRRVAYNPPVDAVSEVKVEAFQPDAAARMNFMAACMNSTNKLFFFFTYEGIKQSEPEPTFATIATTAQRNGEFSGLPGVTIFDPSTALLNNGIITRTAFPGNQIPASRISPISKNILGFFPPPNAVGTSVASSKAAT